MTTRVRVTTQEAPAAVLSYPRDADPVFGADFTEVARLPSHHEQEFVLGASCDLLVVELPIGGPAGGAADAEFVPAFIESEAA